MITNGSTQMVVAPAERNTITLRDLIAVNVRRLRTEAGAGVDDVCKAAGDFGLDWSIAWINGVEKGQRALSAEQLLALPLVLGHAFHQAVSLADLLGGEGRVRLKVAPRNAKSTVRPDPAAEDAKAVELAGLRDAATAIPLRRPFAAPAAASEEKSPLERAAEKARMISKANLGDVDIRALNKAESGATDAEQRLARKLGVPEIVVIAAAASLWGHSLSAERDEQLKDPDAPAKTMLTRQLNQDISDRIEEAANGRFEPERSRLAVKHPALDALIEETMALPRARMAGFAAPVQEDAESADVAQGRARFYAPPADFDGDVDSDEEWRPEPVHVRDSLEQSTVILPLVRPRQQDDTVVLYFPAGIFDED